MWEKLCLLSHQNYDCIYKASVLSFTLHHLVVGGAIYLQSNWSHTIILLCLFLNHGKVPEYAYSLDEEGICKAAFELIFAFDEVISLGHKENVTVAQVKQYCEMESHEEKLHKLVIASKINETKDVMKRKASEIEKSKVFVCVATFLPVFPLADWWRAIWAAAYENIWFRVMQIEKNRGDKGGYMSSMGSGRIESSFSEMSISSSNSGGFGSGSGFGLTTDMDSFSNKPKGLL